MVAVTNEPSADRTKIVHEVGDNRFRHPEALFSLGFSIPGIEQNAHSRLVELEVSAHGEGRKASATDVPEAEQDQHETIAVLAICHFAFGESFSFLHKLDAEIERVPTGDQPVKSVIGLGAG